MAATIRADHVGSLLRPAELLAARNDFTAGILPAQTLKEIEDAATLRALDMQKQAGIDIFSSGEYRRSGWATAIRESVEGLVPNTDTAAPANRLLGQWQGPSAAMATAVTLPGGAAGGRREAAPHETLCRRRGCIPQAALARAVEDHYAGCVLGGRAVVQGRH